VTRIDKSPEQLNAEADESLPHWVCGKPKCQDRSLDHLVETHRRLQSSELFLEYLTTDNPPVFVDPQSGERRAERASQIGPNLSHPMESYITASYGTQYPWAKAAWLLKMQCVREHPEHAGREEFWDSLCARLVSLVIRDNHDPGKAAVRLKIDPDRARRRLARCLRSIESNLYVQRKRWELREREDAGRFSIGEREHVHHVVAGLHEQDCPQCRKRRAA
jgi:hypothetical protein